MLLATLLLPSQSILEAPFFSFHVLMFLSLRLGWEFSRPKLTKFSLYSLLSLFFLPQYRLLGISGCLTLTYDQTPFYLPGFADAFNRLLRYFGHLLVYWLL